MIYVPDQTNYTGTVYFGNGGGSLSHISGTDGFYNTAIGVNALYSNTTGNQNVAQGYGSLYSNLDGNRNIGQGFGTLYSNTSGYDNLAQGNNALFYNTTGSQNVAQGTFALRYNVSGSYNTVTGFQAGYGIAGSSTVSGNSSFGYQSGFTLQTGGNRNSLFGYQAGYNLSTGAYNIAIGQNADLPVTNGSQQLNIGNLIFGTGVYSGSTPTSTSVTSGKVGIGINNPTYTLDVNYTASGTVARFTNSNGNCQINPTSASLICSSDINLKKNINLLNELTISTNTIPFTLDTNIATNSLSILEKILTLTPVTYNWKGEANTDNTHTGFIAQQVEQLFSDLVSTDDKGFKGVNYVGFAPYLVASLQATMNTLNGKEALLNISNPNTDNTINLITNEDNIDVIQAIQDRLSNGYEVITNFVALRVTAIRGYFVKLYSDLIETKKLCLINDNGDKVCTNANQLQNLLNNQNQNNSNNSNNSNSGNNTNTGNTDTNSTENGTTTDNGTTNNNENTDLNNTATTTTQTNTDNNTPDTTNAPAPTPTPETTPEIDNTEAGETIPTPTPAPTPTPESTPAPTPDTTTTP